MISKQLQKGDFMNLEQFKEKSLQVLKVLSYIHNKREFVAPEIESQFHEIPRPTLYRYIEIWSKNNYVKKCELKQKLGNGIQYIYSITGRFDRFFKEFLEEIIRTCNKNVSPIFTVNDLN